MKRDFTFIEDIVEGIVRIAVHTPSFDDDWSPENPTPNASGVAPFRIFNIGRGEPIELMDFISALEEQIGKKAKINFLPMQPGDVENTWCDIAALREAVQYEPKTSLNAGLEKTVAWFKNFYKV